MVVNLHQLTTSCESKEKQRGFLNGSQGLLNFYFSLCSDLFCFQLFLLFSCSVHKYNLRMKK